MSNKIDRIIYSGYYLLDDLDKLNEHTDETSNLYNQAFNKFSDMYKMNENTLEGIFMDENKFIMEVYNDLTGEVEYVPLEEK